MSAYCCTSPSPESLAGTNKFFSRESSRYLKKFHKRGLSKEQKVLMEGILKSPVSGKTLLEIGSGIGAFHLTLLQRGAASAVGVDISEGMIRAARQLAEEMQLASKATYHLGDFVQLNGPLPVQADIVILDKVVCCYEMLDALLEKSLAKSSSVYALTYPRPLAILKLLARGLVFISNLFGWSFHPYWHDWMEMTKKIERSGFRLSFSGNTLIWCAQVYYRLAKV